MAAVTSCENILFCSLKLIEQRQNQRFKDQNNTSATFSFFETYPKRTQNTNAFKKNGGNKIKVKKSITKTRVTVV